MVRGAEGPRWSSHVDGGRRTAWWALEVETFGRNVAAGCVLLLVLFIVLLYFPILLVWFLCFLVERKGRIFVGVVAMDALRGRGQGPALSGLELQTFGGWRVCVFYLIFLSFIPCFLLRGRNGGFSRCCCYDCVFILVPVLFAVTTYLANFTIIVISLFYFSQ